LGDVLTSFWGRRNDVQLSHVCVLLFTVLCGTVLCDRLLVELAVD
jgi:hypothetical protein